METSILARPSIRDMVSEEEWQVRVDLAACYRLLAHFGMTDLIYNHITARVPGPEHHFLINGYGLLYEEITASSLHKIDVDGNVVLRGEGEFDVNPAGFIIHSAVHMAREDAGCVIHTHTRGTAAVAATSARLLPISQSAMFFYGRVAIHNYDVQVERTRERDGLIADLGNSDVMILRNHGSLTVGRTVPSAFLVAYQFEQACRIQADAMGGPLHLVEPDVAVAVRDRAMAAMTKSGAAREWAAMLRLLDRTDTSYRN